MRRLSRCSPETGRWSVIRLLVLALVLSCAPSPVVAQPARVAPDAPTDYRASTATDLRAAVIAYRAALERLLTFHESSVARASEERDKRRDLHNRGLIGPREVDEAERAVEFAQAKLDGTRREIIVADRELTKPIPPPTTIATSPSKSGSLKSDSPQKPHAIASTQPKNPTHEAMTALSERDRNARLSYALRDERCQVTRSFFQGSDKFGGASWNVACANGEALSILINNDARGSTRILECSVLKAVANIECFKKFRDQ
jgi:hypothetical protein